MPRVVASKPMDPSMEKRDIAERLAQRRGAGRLTREEETMQQKLQRDNSDSDDESRTLMRLANALSHLDRTASRQEAAAGDAGDPSTSKDGVGEEGPSPKPLTSASG